LADGRVRIIAIFLMGKQPRRGGLAPATPAETLVCRVHPGPRDCKLIWSART
jgi:hypothetical protein